MLTGVVLAAGDATRMPNKLMLHTPTGPLIMDAVKYAMKHCPYVVVVTKEDSIVESYLKQTRFKLDIRFQTHPTGVVDAISIAESKDILVVFGDCYGYEWLPAIRQNAATVKMGEMAGLDGFGGKKWVARHRPRKHSFVGGFRCSNWNPSSKDLMTEFNAHRIEPQEVKTLIQDCGTPKGYVKLWQR